MTVAFRPANLDAIEDRKFIISTWSSSFKKAHSAGLITSDDWPKVMHDQLGKILTRPGARSILAYEKQSPSFFYGWIAGDTSERTPCVYYVYVKEPYRRAGYAKQLFAELGVNPLDHFVFVCQTPWSIQLREKIPRAKWNPNEVRYPKDTRRQA